LRIEREPRPRFLRAVDRPVAQRDGLAASDGKGDLPGPNGEPPVLARRFKFHDLRAMAAADLAEAVGEEEA
jgi:hypothetical protein